MVQKYQNEIAPILYYGISAKTNEKDLKIPNLQPPDWKSPYWMTLYYKKGLKRGISAPQCWYDIRERGEKLLQFCKAI